MKHILLIGICMAAWGCGSEGGEEPKKNESLSREDKVKARLQELFEISKGGDFSKAGNFVVYRGKNADRKWKDICDYGQEEDQKRVDSICRRIKGLVGKADTIEFVKFQSEKESEGEWLVWTVMVRTGDNEKKVAFACLDIKGNIAVGDID